MFYRIAKIMAPVLRVLRSVVPSSGVLIIPPAGPGSLGDEAMVEGLACALRERGEGPVILYARAGRVDWPELNGVDVYSKPGQGLGRAARLLGHLLRRQRVFVVGADCIDGHYSIPNSVQLITLADLFARCGAASTIVGSSYKDGATAETGEALRKLSRGVKLCARDPDSGERMTDRTDHPVDVVADAAFLLTPDQERVPQAAIRWIESQRAEGRVILAVNFNRQVIKNDDQAQRALSDSYAQALGRLIDDNRVSVLFVPHDYRGDESDLTNAHELYERLGGKKNERVLVAPGRLAPSVAKAIVSHADVALTGRMHLAIGCLGVGTPPACVTYQGKFEGLFKHFGLEGMTLDPQSASDPAALAGLVGSVLERRELLRSTIMERKPSILDLSRKNLEPGTSGV